MHKIINSGILDSIVKMAQAKEDLNMKKSLAGHKK
jgi:hypothetical protein